MFSKIWSAIKNVATRALEALGAIVKGPVVGTGALLLGVGAGVGAAVALVPTTITATVLNGPAAGFGSLGLLTAMTAGLPVIGVVGLVGATLWGLVEAGSFIVRGKGLIEAENWLNTQWQDWDRRVADELHGRRNRRVAAAPAAR